jgi:single-stranded DNA-binding protein
MILALVSGSLFRDPKKLTAKSGKPFVLATVKASDVTGSDFVKIFAWSDHAREALGELADGAAVSITGKLSAEIYTPPGGEPRVSLSISADQVLALKKPVPKKKETSEPKPSGGGVKRIGEGPRSPPKIDDLDDSIPF